MIMRAAYTSYVWQEGSPERSEDITYYFLLPMYAGLYMHLFEIKNTLVEKHLVHNANIKKLQRTQYRK